MPPKKKKPSHGLAPGRKKVNKSSRRKKPVVLGQGQMIIAKYPTGDLTVRRPKDVPTEGSSSSLGPGKLSVVAPIQVVIPDTPSPPPPFQIVSPFIQSNFTPPPGEKASSSDQENSPLVQVSRRRRIRVDLSDMESLFGGEHPGSDAEILSEVSTAQTQLSVQERLVASSGNKDGIALAWPTTSTESVVGKLDEALPAAASVHEELDTAIVFPDNPCQRESGSGSRSGPDLLVGSQSMNLSPVASLPDVLPDSANSFPTTPFDPQPESQSESGPELLVGSQPTNLSADVSLPEVLPDSANSFPIDPSESESESEVLVDSQYTKMVAEHIANTVSLPDMLADPEPQPEAVPFVGLQPTKSVSDRIGYLSKTQREAFDGITTRGENVFLSGAAGTGKSLVTRRVIEFFKKKYPKEGEIGISAPTGIAAFNIDGRTIHSILSITERDTGVTVHQRSRPVWRKLKVLIIDEISMLSDDVLEKIDSQARAFRKSDQVFGNLQLIVCGDFYQLPPVNGKFCFLSKVWKFTPYVLTEVFRQNKDQQFVALLNELRFGNVSPESEGELRKLARPLEPSQPGEIQALHVYSLKRSVTAHNNTCLAKLDGVMHTFTARDTFPKTRFKTMFEPNFMCEATVELKVGAQVMYLRNSGAKLVNGTMGVVNGFLTETLYIQLHEEKEFAKITNYVSAGLRDTNAAPGSGPLPPSSYADLPRNVFSACERLRCAPLGASGCDKVWPAVWFENGEISLVKSHEFKIEKGKEFYKRFQVPLTLAWAISIHKAQGKTVSKLVVDLKNVFEKGQAYVALSRATSRENLQVLNFSRAIIKSSAEVRTFYDTLQNQVSE
ncbi:hypothetical protein OXX80_006391 [Metschnikowia pulcherrima]